MIASLPITNITQLLKQRECVGKRTLAIGRWAESNFFYHHCAAQYTDVESTSKATIAAAYSPDGNLVASTHGDHSVKIFCSATGKRLHVLWGHARTPWVVRFHPSDSDLLASGSLDHTVLLWRVGTASQVARCDLGADGKAVTTFAFHPIHPMMAIAAGNKVYLWQYNASGIAPGITTTRLPPCIYRARKTLRALHFDPVVGNLLLTAEVLTTNTSSSSRAGSGNGIGTSTADSISATDRNAAATATDGDALAAANSFTQTGASGSRAGGYVVTTATAITAAHDSAAATMYLPSGLGTLQGMGMAAGRGQHPQRPGATIGAHPWPVLPLQPVERGSVDGSAYACAVSASSGTLRHIAPTAAPHACTSLALGFSVPSPVGSDHAEPGMPGADNPSHAASAAMPVTAQGGQRLEAAAAASAREVAHIERATQSSPTFRDHMFPTALAPAQRSRADLAAAASGLLMDSFTAPSQAASSSMQSVAAPALPPMLMVAEERQQLVTTTAAMAVVRQQLVAAANAIATAAAMETLEATKLLRRLAVGIPLAQTHEVVMVIAALAAIERSRSAAAVVAAAASAAARAAEEVDHDTEAQALVSRLGAWVQDLNLSRAGRERDTARAAAVWRRSVASSSMADGRTNPAMMLHGLAPLLQDLGQMQHGGDSGSCAGDGLPVVPPPVSALPFSPREGPLEKPLASSNLRHHEAASPTASQAVLLPAMLILLRPHPTHPPGHRSADGHINLIPSGDSRSHSGGASEAPAWQDHPSRRAFGVSDCDLSWAWDQSAPLPPLLSADSPAPPIASRTAGTAWALGPPPPRQRLAQLINTPPAQLLPQPGGPRDTPCTTALSVWEFDAAKPHMPLRKPRLTLPRAILCSEMGCHISHCGRYLAVAVEHQVPPQCQQWMSGASTAISRTGIVGSTGDAVLGEPHARHLSTSQAPPGQCQQPGTAQAPRRPSVLGHRSAPTLQAPAGATCQLAALEEGQHSTEWQRHEQQQRRQQWHIGPQYHATTGVLQPLHAILQQQPHGPAAHQRLRNATPSSPRQRVHQEEEAARAARARMGQGPDLAMAAPTRPMPVVTACHPSLPAMPAVAPRHAVAAARAVATWPLSAPSGAVQRPGAHDAPPPPVPVTAPALTVAAAARQQEAPCPGSSRHTRQHIPPLRPQELLPPHALTPPPPPPSPAPVLQLSQPLTTAAGAGVLAAPRTDSSSRPGPCYELQIYSLEATTFGCLLAARPLQAVHCLTTLQFSPTAEFVLVAYGRRHLSLCNLVNDSGYIIPIFTVMEAYRVSDMALVRSLPSIDDEVNAAVFHPHPGQGLAYATKEGRLRVLRLDRTQPHCGTIKQLLPPPLPQDDEQGSQAAALTLHHSALSSMLVYTDAADGMWIEDMLEAEAPLTMAAA